MENLSFIALVVAAAGFLAAIGVCLFALADHSAVKSVNNRSLGLADALAALRTAFARVDQDHIKKMLSEQTQLGAEIERTKTKLDLLSERLTSYVNRDSSRARIKSEDEDGEPKKKGKGLSMLEDLKASGQAMPLNRKPQPVGTIRRVSEV
jgi:hypothetical protein